MGLRSQHFRPALVCQHSGCAGQPATRAILMPPARYRRAGSGLASWFTAGRGPAEFAALGEDGDPLDAMVLVRDLHHLPEFDRPEIEHFFLICKELEPGKSVAGASWAGRAAAEAEIEASRRRLQETPGPPSAGPS